MPSWKGQRPVAVVSACMAADGVPDFALTEVEVTHEQFENGAHYDLVEARLFADGYEEPFVHFDEADAPRFLFPAVRQYLGVPGDDPGLATATRQEER